ncbi:MAG: branched-chain amino acid ABC transporter permease [Acetobacteraceae bacterium]
MGTERRRGRRLPFVDMGIFVIQVLNSLFYASVLFLIASGLTLIFGVMRIVNLAHGSLYAVGAYITAWLVGHAVAGGFTAGGLIYLLLLPLGAIGVGVLGALLEPSLLRPFYQRAEEYQLLVTFGLLLILEDGIRFIWGGVPLAADAVADTLPSVKILGFLYPAYNFVVIAVGVVAVLALWGFVYRTRFGVLLRATAQDRRMASALGLDVRRVYLLAFTIGCFMAGIGGAIVVPSQAAVLGMGIDALVVAFIVVVIGGMGSLKGALVGALIVSFFRTIGVEFFPEEELAFLYLLAGIVLVVRPTGLFGTA